MSQAPQPQQNLFLRNDTMLGVCEGIGQDFGFNPLYLRVAFAVMFYFIPYAVAGLYLGLGLILAFARWVAPVPGEAVKAEEMKPAESANQAEDEQLPLAA